MTIYRFRLWHNCAWRDTATKAALNSEAATGTQAARNRRGIAPMGNVVFQSLDWDRN
jgi:hypothetical protein